MVRYLLAEKPIRRTRRQDEQALATLRSYWKQIGIIFPWRKSHGTHTIWENIVSDISFCVSQCISYGNYGMLIVMTAKANKLAKLASSHKGNPLEQRISYAIKSIALNSLIYLFHSQHCLMRPKSAMQRPQLKAPFLLVYPDNLKHDSFVLSFHINIHWRECNGNTVRITATKKPSTVSFHLRRQDLHQSTAALLQL